RRPKRRKRPPRPRRRRPSALPSLRPPRPHAGRADCFSGGPRRPPTFMDLRPYIEKFGRRLSEVEAALSDPAVFDNKQRAQELSPEYARLKELVATGSAYTRTFADLEANRALLKSEPVGSEIAELAREEIARLEIEEGRLALAVRHGVLPPDPTD